MKSCAGVSLFMVLFLLMPGAPVLAAIGSSPACPSVQVLARQWAEAIAAGALLGRPEAKACLSPRRYPDIRLPAVPPSEPPESESLSDSVVLPNEGFRVEEVRAGELGTKVVRLSWRDAATGKRVEDELSLLLNQGGAAKDLGCASLYDAFKKHRVRLQGCR